MVRRIVVEWDCPGVGCNESLHYDTPRPHRRVLDPGSYVLIEKVDGKWPITNQTFDAAEDALIRTTGRASMRGIEVTINAYLDALAEGDQE